MTIITQDGHRLETAELGKIGKVKFETGRYAGRESTYYVNAEIRKWNEDVVKHVSICLGEYGDDEMTAEYVKENLEESLASGRKFVNMGAALAPRDDLMASLKAIDNLYPQGYYLEVGMINGITNSRDGFNPDKDGSYVKAVAARYQKMAIAS